MGPARRGVKCLAAQGFALLETFVGIFTIILGIGPRTMLDAGLHAPC
jgi:hypothetical protein